MIYLFEDDENTSSSRLFRFAYGNERTKDFIYSFGNGKMLSKCESLLRSSDEDIVAFVDMSPDNVELRKIYNKLARIAKKFVKSDGSVRLHVIPIICAEYYMIKLLDVVGLLSSTFIDIDKCEDNSVDIDRLRKDACSEIIKNYEKYCKDVLKIKAADCAKSNSIRKDKYNKFYDLDCECESCRMNCYGMILREKSVNLLKQYIVVPAIGADGFKTMSCREAHKKSVDEYNRVRRKFIGCDNNNSIEYIE